MEDREQQLYNAVTQDILGWFNWGPQFVTDAADPPK